MTDAYAYEGEENSSIRAAHSNLERQVYSDPSYAVYFKREKYEGSHIIITQYSYLNTEQYCVTLTGNDGIVGLFRGIIRRLKDFGSKFTKVNLEDAAKRAVKKKKELKEIAEPFLKAHARPDVLRKAEQLPEPDKPGNAEVNRNRVQVKYRTEPERISALNEAAKVHGVSRAVYIDYAIDQALRLENPSP